MKFQIFFPLSFVLIFSVCSCDPIGYDWHRYHEKQTMNIETEGISLVISHGWKIFEGSLDSSSNYEWGWEATINLEKSEGIKNNVHIQKIEYELFDKDNFKVGSSQLILFNNDFMSDLEKALIPPDKRIANSPSIKSLIEEETPKIFRKSGSISKMKALRSSYGACRVTLYKY